MSLQTLSLTIPAGHSMSSGVDCSGSIRILRIIVPPVWDAAPLTFQTSTDGVVYNNLHLAAPVGDFTTYPATVPIVTPGAAITMPPNTGYGISWLRFRSGTFTAQTKQSQDATFQVVLEMPDVAGGGGTGTVGPTGPAGPIGPAGPQGIHGDPAAPALLQTVVLGHAKGVNYNVIGDTAIAIAAAKYAITQLVTFNNVGGADNYTGSLRDAPNGAGTDLGGYAYNTDGQLGDWSDFPGPLPVIANPMLYFHIGTKEGAPATGDLYVMGYDLTGL